MSRTERLRLMHERRALWQPIPRCATCGRVLSVLTPDGDSPCERCLTIAGVVTADSPAVVTSVFQAAVRGIEEMVEQTRAERSIWDPRLQDREISARVVSSSARGQKGWSVLQLAPTFGEKVERFALTSSAIAMAVRVVLAGVSASPRVSDLRTGRTLILDAA
jgi:hypothetical protein